MYINLGLDSNRQNLDNLFSLFCDIVPSKQYYFQNNNVLHVTYCLYALYVNIYHCI